MADPVSMRASARLRQHPDQIVQLDGWEPDAEFPIGPQGAKPKRILICPTPAPQPFLIAGHRYLFKEPTGIHEQQIWSEAIAYELSRDLEIHVPPAFLAVGPGNGSPGVLVEFFYGYQSEPQIRFVHAIDRLQGLGRSTDHKLGSLKDNIDLCRFHHVPKWKTWWARTVTFDALIGNTDRHSENWGFLTEVSDGRLTYSLAPAFDNGTSLGYIVREQDLEKYLSSTKLHEFVARGRHHYGWVGIDREGAQHARLCDIFRTRYPDTTQAMCAIARVNDIRIEQLMGWCCSFAFPLPFSDRRAAFVAAQLHERRDALLAILER